MRSYFRRLWTLVDESARLTFAYGFPRHKESQLTPDSTGAVGGFLRY